MHSAPLTTSEQVDELRLSLFAIVLKCQMSNVASSREQTFFEQLEVDFDLMKVAEPHLNESRGPLGSSPRATTDRRYSYAALREVHFILGARRGCL